MSDAASHRLPARRPARVLALLALGVAVSAPFWIDPVLQLAGWQTPAASRLAATRSGIEAEQRRLGLLEQQIEATIAELDRGRAEAARLKAGTDALTNWSRLYAVTDLAAALHQTEPFGLQLAVARAVAQLPEPISRLLDQIAPYAAIGVPDAARINRDFISRANRLGWSPPDAAAGAVVNRLLAWSSEQIAGDSSSNEAINRRLTEASGRLAVGDIAGAADLVAQLSPPAHDTFADWLEDAGARVAADRLSHEVDLIVSRERAGPLGAGAVGTGTGGTHP